MYYKQYFTMTHRNIQAKTITITYREVNKVLQNILYEWSSRSNEITHNKVRRKPTVENYLIHKRNLFWASHHLDKVLVMKGLNLELVLKEFTRQNHGTAGAPTVGTITIEFFLLILMRELEWRRNPKIKR